MTTTRTTLNKCLIIPMDRHSIRIWYFPEYLGKEVMEEAVKHGVVTLGRDNYAYDNYLYVEDVNDRDVILEKLKAVAEGVTHETMVVDNINKFNKKHDGAAYTFAHIVLDDYNLGDSSILFCMNAMPNWFLEQMTVIKNDEPPYKLKQLMEYTLEIYNFLDYLLSIDEDTREKASEILWGGGS